MCVYTDRLPIATGNAVSSTAAGRIFEAHKEDMQMGNNDVSLLEVLRAIKNVEPMHGPMILPSSVPASAEQIDYLLQNELLSLRWFGSVVFATGLSDKGNALLADLEAKQRAFNLDFTDEDNAAIRKAVKDGDIAKAQGVILDVLARNKDTGNEQKEG